MRYNVVFVVGVSGEDGVEVECIDAQGLQIVQLLKDAGQIATVKGDDG